MKKYFVFSDVHGQYDAMIKALNDSGYDRNNNNHYLISAGDLFDRGNQHDKIYEFLSGIERKFMILGNHDQFLLDWITRNEGFEWNCTHNGFWETLSNFAGLPDTHTWHYWLERELELKAIIFKRHPNLLNFINSMIDGIKIGKVIITHAGFTQSYTDFKWYVYNFSATPKFVKLTQDKFPEFQFIFGHWHAFRLSKEYLEDYNYFSKFEYKNYIGIDACSNFFNQVFVHVFESDEELELFGGSMSLEFLMEYDKLKTL